VVVDDELRASLEHIGQPDRPVLADQCVVRHLDHGQAAALGGDGIQFAGGRLLSAAQVVEGGAPSVLVDDWG
jgi:hypothetical protein